MLAVLSPCLEGMRVGTVGLSMQILLGVLVLAGLAALSFSQPEKYARRQPGMKEFDFDASIYSSS